jgi:Protein of unknown function (DUF1588)/Protein of unknown function (DUF1592)/Protein of unknown function (DUF1595)/Protein of unknown function (DUF1587)/Protein of unknown function (DUF1585)
MRRFLRDHLAAATLGLMAAALPAAACVGSIGDPDGGEDTNGPAGAEQRVGVQGARRLTAVEYNRTVRDLLGEEDANAELILPSDRRTPFDNELALQTASAALISGAELLAGTIAGKLVADPARRAAVVGCEPAGPGDKACFEKFIRSFGRRAFRRPIADSEVSRFAALIAHGEAEGDFWVAVDSALRAFLQHPSFLYRVEHGTQVPGQVGTFALSDHELATRMSYFLTGTTPPGWLLDDADAGKLTTDDGARAAAAKLLESEDARKAVARFHALWIGWEATANPSMQIETNALLDRVLFDERGSFQDLLRADQTYVDAALAEVYGLPPPASGGFAWVRWGDTGRQGLLSQGAFLSLGSKFADTSPTQRGLLVRTRLFCHVIAQPPPGIDADQPPKGKGENACKIDRYDMSTREGCKGCHAQMDPIGFGLENYDASGRFRETQVDRPDCPISGEGELDGIGKFNGPKELSDLLIQEEDLSTCVVTHLYRFAMGRYKLDTADLAFIEKLTAEAAPEGEIILVDALQDFVGSPEFRLRREEPAP